MPKYDIPAAQEAQRLGVDRTTLVKAIKDNLCGGEERNGYWYTSTAAASKWYSEHYRHAGALYSQAAGKSWTHDLPIMRGMIAAGKSVEEIAAALKRSVGAVKVKACKEGIKPVKIAKQARRQEAAIISSATPSQGFASHIRAAIAEDGRQRPQDWYEKRRQDDRDGRLRIHVSPAVKLRLAAGLARINGGMPNGERVTMAQFLSWAGLVALDDETIISRGRELASTLGE